MTIKEYIEKKNRTAKLLKGKTKIETSDVIGKGITLIGYGFMEDNGKEYAVVTLKEFPNNFLFCGKVLTDEIRKLEEEFGDDLNDILASGEVRIILNTQSSKNGRKYTSVDFLES